MKDQETYPMPSPSFAFPVGPWFRWFAWRPTRTVDRGWRWLRPVWRRRYQSHDHLDGPTMLYFLTSVVRPEVDES